MDCYDPGVPRHGYRHGNNFKYNSTINFSCKAQHHLEGAREIKCQGNGKWSAAVPKCLGEMNDISNSACCDGLCTVTQLCNSKFVDVDLLYLMYLLQLDHAAIRVFHTMDSNMVLLTHMVKMSCTHVSRVIHWLAIV